MSIQRRAVWAPNPSTTRGQPTPLSADAKGERIAYASGKSIYLRSLDDPSQTTQYTGHTAPTTVARFAPSGYYVASGDTTGMVRVWAADNEECTLKGEYPIINGRITDIAWDGESKRILAVGDGKEAYGRCIMWDSGNSVGEISGHTNIVNTASVRPVRPYRAATAGDDANVVFLNGPPFKFASSFKGHHTKFVNAIAFSPDGAYLVSVGADRKIFLWDGKTGELVSQVQDGDNSHKGGIFAVSWEKDSKRFVTASADQSVKVWDVESQKNIYTWSFGEPATVDHHQVGVIWPSRTDGLIISLSKSGDFNYLSLDKKEPIRIVQGHQLNITSISIESGSNTLWTGSLDGRVCSWDLTTGNCEIPEGQSHSNQVVGFATSQGRVYSVGMDDTLRTLDSSVKTFTGGASSTEGQPKGITAASESGTVIIVTTSKILVYTDGKETGSLAISYNPTSITFSSAISTVAVGDQDNTIHLYTLSGSTLKASTVLSSNRASITALSFAPNSALLAAGDSSGKIVLYDEKGGVQTTRWGFHTGRIASIAWNEAGTHVVSGSLDTNVFVYSVANPGKNIKTANAHKDGVNAVAWVDAKTVVSAGADGCVKVWDVALA